MKQCITIKINKKAINEKYFIKYLGVLIYSTLSWKYHISKKISQSIGIMYKLRPFLPLKVLKNVYCRLMTFNDSFHSIPDPLIPPDPIFAKLEILKVVEVYKFQVSKVY